MAVTVYPNVIDEYETIQKLISGYSISRYGDGECKCMRGAGYVREQPNQRLAQELLNIIMQPHPMCLVGIPGTNRESPKWVNWKKRQPDFLPYLSPKVTYYSSWISRPDSAPWVISMEYVEAVERLWLGRKVALVCEPTSKLLPVIKTTARKVVHIPCVSHGAYAHLEEYEHAVLRGRPDIAILSHGVSATCLAHRLASKGLQAIDLGSIGGFLARMLPVDKVSHVFPFALHHPEYQGDLAAMQAALESLGFQVLFAGERDGTTKEEKESPGKEEEPVHGTLAPHANDGR